MSSITNVYMTSGHIWGKPFKSLTYLGLSCDVRHLFGDRDLGDLDLDRRLELRETKEQSISFNTAVAWCCAVIETICYLFVIYFMFTQRYI